MTKPNRHSMEEKMPGLYRLGEKYIALGEAFQDDRTSLDDIAALAIACGLVLHIALEPMSEEKAPVTCAQESGKEE